MGFLLGEKNPKLTITSTIQFPPNEWPRLTTKLQHFTRQFYIYFSLSPPLDPPGDAHKWATLPPHYEMGSNAAIPLNKEDN